jgi:hypothetical protein
VQFLILLLLRLVLFVVLLVGGEKVDLSLSEAAVQHSPL